MKCLSSSLTNLLWILLYSSVMILTSCGVDLSHNKGRIPTELSPSINGTVVIPTRTPIAKNTTVSTLMPSGIPATTDAPTPSEERTDFKFKVAYLFHDSDQEGQFPNPKIMIFNYPDLQPREIYTYPPESSFDRDQTWSNNGRLLAFHRNEKQKFIITVVDTITEEASDYPIPIQDHGNLPAILSLDWSLNDRWIAFSVSDRSNFGYIQSFVMDLTDGRSWPIEEGTKFISWSPRVANQYLSIHHMNQNPGKSEDQTGGNVIVYIGIIGEKSPMHTISDLDKLTSESWLLFAPDGNIAIATTNDTYGTIVFQLDFNLGEWKRIAYIDSQYASPWMWSPDGNWVSFLQGRKLSLWNIWGNGRPFYEIPMESTTIYPLGWKSNSSLFFYQDGLIIYMVKPTHTDEPIPILDLSHFDLDEMVIDQIYYPPISFWISP